jgi:virginiamycin B lyase
MKRTNGLSPAGLLTIGAMLGMPACSTSPGALPSATVASSTKTLAAARERITVKTFEDLPMGTASGVSYHPSNLTVGPDGAIWVTDDIDQDSGPNAVARISTSGRRTNTYFYSGRTSQGSSLGSITTGPDGALWMTDAFNFEVLRMTLDGTYTRFPLGGDATPNNIIAGPDNALWFTDSGNSGSNVVRMTTAGAMTPYPEPGALVDLAVGRDKALWITDFEGNIDRLTTAGKITEYSKGLAPGAQPNSIAPGPDGALWFTDLAGRIGRITTRGRITEYSRGISQAERPQYLVAGPDGAMWFTEHKQQSSSVGGSKIGRITMQGNITEYSTIDPNSQPLGIAEGVKGDIWFVESNTNEVGRIRISRRPR